MPVPPLPPGAGEALDWILLLVVAAIIIIGVIWILRYMLAPGILTPPTRQSTGNEALEELLREIRLLRKDIEELKRELQE